MQCSRCAYRSLDTEMLVAHFDANHAPELRQTRASVCEVDVLPEATRPRLVYHRPTHTYQVAVRGEWIAVDLES